jgi:hypothetical protein
VREWPAVLETRLRQAQSEKLTPFDLVSTLVSDELRRVARIDLAAANGRSLAATQDGQSPETLAITDRLDVKDEKK